MTCPRKWHRLESWIRGNSERGHMGRMFGYTPEQTSGKLREVDVLGEPGNRAAEAIRRIGAVPCTYRRWRKDRRIMWLSPATQVHSYGVKPIRQTWC